MQWTSELAEASTSNEIATSGVTTIPGGFCSQGAQNVYLAFAASLAIDFVLQLCVLRPWSSADTLQVRLVYGLAAAEANHQVCVFEATAAADSADSGLRNSDQGLYHI